MSRILIAVAIVCSLHASRASAGPIEEFRQILLHPSNPDALLARWQYGGDGIFYSADRGKSWKVMCASMIAPGEKAEGSMVLTGDGGVLLGFFTGLWQGQNNGCSWGKATALDGQRITDVTLHPTDPMIAFAVTGNGNAGSLNGMRQRAADGTWTELGKQEELLINRIRVVQREGGLRFYESAQRGTRKAGEPPMEIPNYLIRVSDDMGATWREFPVDITKGTFRLEAVDPSNADRIVLSINNNNAPDKVLVSSDQGATMKDFAMITELRGVTLAPDGRIWLADFGDPGNPTVQRGIFAAPNLDTAPTQLTNEYQAACVTYQASTNTLYGCQRWAAGTLDPTTAAFSPLASFMTVSDFISCDGTDSAAMCKSQLCADWCGPMHFASSPLCTAYHDPMCGPTADQPLGAPVAGSGAAGAMAAGISGGAAGQSPLPTGGKQPQGGGQSGGCATTTSGPIAGGAAGQMAFVALCAILLFRRRRALGPLSFQR